jgi:hypothetical protein
MLLPESIVARLRATEPSASRSAEHEIAALRFEPVPPQPELNELGDNCLGGRDTWGPEKALFPPSPRGLSRVHAGRPRGVGMAGKTRFKPR